jgi:hypothetical protein
MGMDLVAVRWTQLGMGNGSHAWDTVGNENGRTRNGSLPLAVLIVVIFIYVHMFFFLFPIANPAHGCMQIFRCVGAIDVQ